MNTHYYNSGDLMNKSYFAVAIAVICVFGFGITSHAQDADVLVVDVPFDFVMASTTMPAGTYRVARLSDDSHSGIVFRGDGNVAVILPKTVEETSIPKALLTFEHAGDKYFLGKIETPGHTYTITTPRPIMALAKTTDITTVPASGTN